MSGETNHESRGPIQVGLQRPIRELRTPNPLIPREDTGVTPPTQQTPDAVSTRLTFVWAALVIVVKV